MKNLILTLAALGTLAWMANPAMADQRRSSRVHRNLKHRAIEREIIHDDAHRHRMSRYQHHRLHDDLNREARRDAIRHQRFHDRHRGGYVRYYEPRRYYSPYVPYYNRGGSIGIHGNRFSFLLGF